MVAIDGKSLTIEQVIAVSRDFEKVKLAKGATKGIKKSRDFVEKILKENRVVYGITTGFGELSSTSISSQEAHQLQENLIRSHAVGVGEPLSEDVVRGVILLRANALAKGYSGVRKQIIDLLISLLNNQVYPYIPSQGSVGASGDLAPLSHLALVLMGEGECIKNGKRCSAKKILKEKKLQSLKIEAKEGLALINGTQVMSSIGCLAVKDAERLLKNAQIAGVMSLEALKGTAKAFDSKIHELRPYGGQTRCASNLRRLVNKSHVVASHKDCNRVQDAYTLRCMPQVYGAVMDTIDHVKNVLSIEINSATDNPLIFADEKEVISGGNFHGEPLAFAMDFLGIAMAEIANISERTVDRLVNPHVSGLPPFLTEHSGLHSGMMITQYTAASLVSENKVLAHPSSVDSIPTSAGQEDHVSMGTISARNAAKIIQNVENVIAIEMLCATQGLDFCQNIPGEGTLEACDIIRSQVKHLDHDRILYKDIAKIKDLIISGEIVKRIETKIGPLD